jgi:hypothetical protein
VDVYVLDCLSFFFFSSLKFGCLYVGNPKKKKRKFELKLTNPGNPNQMKK